MSTSLMKRKRISHHPVGQAEGYAARNYNFVFSDSIQDWICGVGYFRTELLNAKRDMKKKQQIRRDKPRKRECIPQYIVNHRHRRASWLDVSRVITEIKQRVLSEKDPLKRQVWAEVGVQLNGMFLRIESYQHFNI